VSAKKLMRARVRAASGAPAAGKTCEGYASARKVATMADSVMISPLKSIVGTRPRCERVRGISYRKMSSTYRVDVKIPLLPRLLQVNDSFLVLEPQLLQHDVRAVCERTSVVCVVLDARCVAVDLGHLCGCRI
jgi:hypothetical protein